VKGIVVKNAFLLRSDWIGADSLEHFSYRISVRDDQRVQTMARVGRTSARHSAFSVRCSEKYALEEEVKNAHIRASWKKFGSDRSNSPARKIEVHKM